jgi:folate-binding Fe-S cluster repair protein YgfZ
MSVTRKEYDAFRERGGIIDLVDRVKLLFTGNDCARYINGQVTANVASAKTPSVLPACVTTAKGKLCAEVRVSLGPGGILIDADPDVAETLPARFERYIIADDVTMEDATHRVAIVHLIGMPIASVPENIRAQLVASNRFGISGWDWFPPFRENLQPTWDELAQLFPVLSPELLEPQSSWNSSASSKAFHAGDTNSDPTHSPPKPDSIARTSTFTRAATSGRKSSPASKASAT